MKECLHILEILYFSSKSAKQRFFFEKGNRTLIENYIIIIIYCSNSGIHYRVCYILVDSIEY